ncbi:hypothetical protein B4135_0939 [Caldibacillus debilis]|uniref:Uncharacterized protein n=1 Tax=Caldibacillus debilis TaxID=301148 RepID=A0A150M5Z0_9BACI|nr:hypothetical protein B4135_0939 [Caldibacillus debilis]
MSKSFLVMEIIFKDYLKNLSNSNNKQHKNIWNNGNLRNFICDK